MRRTRSLSSVFLLSVLSGLSACREDPQKTDTGLQASETDTWSFQFYLAQDTASAGDEVAYSAELQRGEETLAVQPLLSSDLEPELRFDADSLQPTVAGIHELDATLDYEGEAFTASATLTVQAADPAGIDLLLSDYSMQAGDVLIWTVALWDTWDNPLDSELATVSVDDAAASLGDGTLECTTPGTYTLTASAGDTHDSEYVVVTAGEAASIELRLSDNDIEQYETVSASITVLDSWGNEAEQGGSLWVEAESGADASSVVISGNNLTFEQEGIFTVVAGVDTSSGTLQDSVGPLLVDSSGPLLDIQQPERGAWSESSTGTVSGAVNDDWSGVADLTIDEQPVTVAGDGSFSTELDWEFGLNLVQSVASDGDGNSTEDLRAVLAGDFLAYGAGLSSGLLARINEGGLDTLEGLATDLSTGLDIASLIPDPAYQDSYDYCVFGACVEMYAITLTVDDATFGSVGLEMDPQPGLLFVTFTVYDPQVDWSADGVLLGSDYTGDGTITADSIAVSCDLTPYVQDGIIHVTVSDVAVTSTNFQFDFDSWLYDVIDYLGADISGMIQGYMEDAIIEAVEEQVPALIEDTLQDLELSTSLPILDEVYTFDAVPEDIQVDEDGLTLALETSFTADAWNSPYTGLGSLYADYSAPVYGATPGMVVSVSLDFLNQALFAFWGAGLLDMSMTGDELGVDPTWLSTLFPDLASLSIGTEALLPPVVVPGAGSGLMDLQLGDLLLTLYDGTAEAGNEWMEIYVSALAELSVSATDSAIGLTVDNVQVYFDVVYPDANSIGSNSMEDLLQTLLPMLLPTLTDAVSQIPIPAIEGFTLDNIVVSLSGAESGYLDLGGDLLQTP